MRKGLQRALGSVLAVMMALTGVTGANAQTTSTAPRAGDVTVTNNTGAYDLIVVGGLAGGDKVIVYTAATGGKLLGSATASTGKTEVTIRLSQLGTAAGSIYVSVTGKGQLESSRTKVDYSAEVQTGPPSSSNIVVTNNAGKADLVYVSGLFGGETIKVYTAQTDGKLLGSTTVAASKTEVTLKITQIGIEAGSVYVSLTNKGELESTRTKIDYVAEPKSTSLHSDYITIVNNAGINDTITVTYLSLGDTVYVYDAARGGNLLASAKVASSKTEVSMNVTQLGKTEGYCYISVLSLDKRESERIPVYYPAENTSNPPAPTKITVVNNGNTADTITVTGLAAGDILKVYNKASGGTLLGSGTVATSKTEVTVSIAQLTSEDGYVYLSITGKGKFESARTKMPFLDEPVSDTVNVGKVIITNNVGSSDTIYVTGLTAGDVIKAYDASSGGNLLGTATVAASKTEATISVTQLGTSGGYVYISLTSKNKLEGSRTGVYYVSEPVSNTADVYNIAVVNNPSGKADTVTVTGLTANDIIKVYDLAADGSLMGTSTVAASKTEATVSITQLGASAGYVYVTVTSKGKNESARIKVEYLAEAVTQTPDGNNIIVTNNVAGTADTVEVTGLNGGDMIKVYTAAQGGTLLGYSEVPSSGTYATVSVTQLGTAAGSVYVSITGSSKLESTRIKADYAAEGISSPVDTANIAIANNSLTADSVEVTGLTAGDVVKVYNAAKGGTLLGTATVSEYSTYATVSINQLGTVAGSVYVSVTSKNKQESERTKADYSAESRSESAEPENIVISNNAGTSDIIQVTGLNTGDTVKVYNAAAGGTLLGSATVDSGTLAQVSIAQLGTVAGSVYISVTNQSKSESARTKVDYEAEAKSAAPSASAIEITNNVGTADVIKVTGLTAGDVVKVYESEKAGTVLATASVDTYASSATLSVTQLGSVAGSVYVSVTSKNKLESDRTKEDYLAEAKTTAPPAARISVENNAGVADTIKVTGLTGGDVVNIYDAVKAGTLLGTAETGVYDSSVTLSVTQLGSEAGSVYVTLTSKNKTESDRTKADYDAEPKSTAPTAANITIVNNAGIDDTVKVTGLTGSDVVKVYDKSTGGNLLGSATVSTYEVEATVLVSQLGGTAGTAYVTVTRKSHQESDRVSASYSAEPKSSASDASSILVTNNANAADTVKINNLTGGDVVYVYSAATSGSVLATATVGTYDSSATLTITQLGTDAGYVYVSVKRKGKLESDRTAVPYAAEQKSDPALVGNITVTNNSGISDTVVVSYLQEGDVVKVYNAASSGTLLGTATVAADTTEVKVTITQLGTSAGYAYISVTSPNKLESDRTSVSYLAEATTDAPLGANVKVVNNASISDNLTVTFLKPNDVVRVYSKASAGTLLGSGTVAEDTTGITLTVTGLEANGGYVYVTVTSLGYAESSRTTVAYAAEQQTPQPSSSNIVVTNNAGMSDTVLVSFLDNKDVVRVYDAAAGGNLLGSATCTDSNYVLIKMTQLGTTAGNVYVTVTAYGSLESVRTLVYYSAEPTSDAPDAGDITVINNSGKSDTITVTGLMEFDVVNIYSSATGGTLLGTGTVSEDDDSIILKVSQLGSSAGYIYVTVTSTGAYESSRVKVAYSAE